MNTGTILRHLLADDESLRRYYQGEEVNFSDIRMRMFLRERSENRWIPDHHYRLLQERSFSNLFNLADVLTKGIGDLATELLEFKSGRVYVSKKKTNLWQDIITYLPPLILQSAFFQQNHSPADLSKPILAAYYSTILKPNFRYTALPHPFIREIESFINTGPGFNDLHMHLNGSTETDVAWQDYLADPNKVFDEFSNAFKDTMVREQLEQESTMFDPATFRNLLYTARRLREVIYQQVFFPGQTNWKDKTLKQLFAEISSPYSTRVQASYYHPFALLAGVNLEDSNEISVEALMYVVVLKRLEEYHNEFLSSMFHYYLLIQGLCNRLLVQQIHQYGFEQFQKLTLNGLREHSERQYIARFKQIQGNELRNIVFLEGRFSPKKTEADNVALLDAIIAGWTNMKKLIGPENDDPDTGPKLRLVAHFIKRKDSKDPYIRHKVLRKDIIDRANALTPLLKHYPKYKKLITGADAAASEFDAPPEVFAPVFRLLRRQGINHFTYHAGEDFHHLLSGMRAIMEAVIFTGLRKNDRIGHAVAAGLSPDVWLRALGQNILISQGEWLDDLVFVWSLMQGSALKNLNKIEAEIAKYSKIIYHETLTPKQLVNAWHLRATDPVLAFGGSSYSDVEEQVITEKAQRMAEFRIFEAYHSLPVRDRYHQLIEIGTCKLIGKSQLVDIQKALLKYLAGLNIIMETLPTSNIRIGHHRDYSTYHLWNWLKWRDAGNDVPDIVLGTDDTGIFATNIINEYSNIFAQLTTGKHMSATSAMEIIQYLDYNGNRFRFENSL